MKLSAGASKIKTVLVRVVILILILVSSLCFFAARWYIKVYGDLGFDSILVTLSALSGVESGLVSKFILNAVVPALVVSAVVCLVLLWQPEKQWKVGKVKVYPFSKLVALILALVLSGGMLLQAADDTGLPTYLLNRWNESTLIRDEYVDPDEVTIMFPEEKRNLIYIFMESMEVTYLAEEAGGAKDVTIIPELYTLAEENINFSHHDGVGGFQQTNGTTWTIGAMVGHTAGVPLKTPRSLEDRFNDYGVDGVFLPGITTMADILHDNGYYQALMVGSDASFGGRDAYYRSHQTDCLYDLFTAREDGIIPEGYYVWWGMEDKYLYEYARQELLEMSEMDQPFAFTMLTVDTHHVGGYVCEYCDSEYEEQYDNVNACASRQVMEFVQWIQQQDFYENTTIVICGDHLSMDNEYFLRTIDQDYTRRVYNCFINAAAETEYDKNRVFTTYDMFPTTLAAMGCQIEGEQLGLGVNLFSGVPTLAEEMGFGAFNAELASESAYYEKEFLK